MKAEDVKKEISLQINTHYYGADSLTLKIGNTTREFEHFDPYTGGWLIGAYQYLIQNPEVFTVMKASKTLEAMEDALPNIIRDVLNGTIDVEDKSTKVHVCKRDFCIDNYKDRYLCFWLGTVECEKEQANRIITERVYESLKRELNK